MQRGHAGAGSVARRAVGRDWAPITSFTACSADRARKRELTHADRGQSARSECGNGRRGPDRSRASTESSSAAPIINSAEQWASGAGLGRNASRWCRLAVGACGRGSFKPIVVPCSDPASAGGASGPGVEPGSSSPSPVKNRGGFGGPVCASGRGCSAIRPTNTPQGARGEVCPVPPAGRRQSLPGCEQHRNRKLG
jgi:hypothetical protein